MRPTLLVVSLALILSGGLACAEPPSPQQSQIEPLRDEMMLAANAHDTDRFLAPYRHDGSLVFAVNGTVIHGWDHLREQQLKWFNGGKSDAVFSQPAAASYSVLSPTIVVVTAGMAMHGTSPDGKVTDGHFVLTEIWQKLAAGWKITYCHESWQ